MSRSAWASAGSGKTLIAEGEAGKNRKAEHSIISEKDITDGNN